MAFDSLDEDKGGGDTVTPMEIAQHTLFTAREKIDLLNQLKADLTGAQHEGRAMAVDAEEIDAAIAEVQQGAQDGAGPEAVLRGDL